MKYHYNDNELLYLIREKEDSALEIIYQKYTPMIKKRIGDFKIKYKNKKAIKGFFLTKISI